MNLSTVMNQTTAAGVHAMDLLSFLFFLPACFALNMSPGPNNLLALNNAKRYGFRPAVLAGAGRLLAFSVMIALAASGLAVVLYTSEVFFFVLKIGGAAYLFWLAFRLWFADTNASEELPTSRAKNLQGLARQEFLLASGNPKAILIFTAFLPQFVDPNGPILTQFALVGGLFLLLEWVAIAVYASFGVYLRQWFSAPRSRKLFNRGSASLLAMAGLGLLLARREAS